MGLYCVEFGEAGRPTLVLLHGLGMAHRMWQPQCEALGRDYHVLAPDLPGFARSAGERPFTLTGAARQVAELIRERTGTAAHVCGLSLGGLVALQMAVFEPESVRSLILSAAQARAPAALMAFEQLVFAALPEKTLLDGLATDLPTRDAGLLRAAREDAAQTGKAGMRRALSAAAQADFRATLGQMRQPALVVCGSRDWANLPAARALARGITGAELRIITDAGHVWNLEMPETFNELARQWVEWVEAKRQRGRSAR